MSAYSLLTTRYPLLATRYSLPATRYSLLTTRYSLPATRYPPLPPMILFLRALFIVIIASMLAVTSWASLHTPLFAIPREVLSHPWFIATLFDAYWAFVTFFVWVAWKEGTLAARVLWFVAIVALGNLAMAAYMLRELFRVPATGPLAAVFTRRNAGALLLPAVLTAASVTVYLLA